MNPFDEWHNFRAFTGAQHNKTATLSDVAINVQLTTAGWWAITADVDFHVRGPDATSTAVSTADHHEWKKDYWLVRTEGANEFVSVVRSGSVSGTYWIGRVKGV